MARGSVIEVGAWKCLMALQVLVLTCLWFMSSAVGAADVTLAWDAVSGASGYTVHWGTASRNYPSQASAGASTTRTVTGLADGTTYYFAVTANDGAGNTSGYSNELFTTTPAVAPVANFSVSTTSGNAPLSVNFTSTSTGTITTYAWTFGDGTSSSSQNPAKVYSSPGTYTVALTVTGPGGSNTKTNASFINVTAVVDTTAPSVPGSPVATASGTSTINLSWTASTDNIGVTGYRVERCSGPGCSGFAQVATPTGTSWSNTGLSASTSYSYRVRAVDAAGNLSGYSSVVTTSTGTAPDTTAPSVPTGLTAVPNGSTTIDVSWDAATDNVAVTGYRLQRCQGASCSSWAQIATPTTTSYTDNGRTPGTTYRYRVRALDAAGNLSSYSSAVSATTPAEAPVASFNAAPTSGPAPLTVNFTSTSTGSITSYAWSFGDGTTSTAQNPSKVYPNGGTYTVSLTVTGSGGSHTSTRTGLVTATEATTVTDRGLIADEHSASGTLSNLNGILEPGETVQIAPLWELTSGGPVAVTGTGKLTGPGNAVYTLLDGSASYGTLMPGAMVDCQTATSDCYRLSIGNPNPRPSLRWEVTFTETLSNGTQVARTLHVGKSFPDVPTTDPFYSMVESLVRNNVTLGYPDGTFKSVNNTMRAQTAMFLARGAVGRGGDADIPASGTVPSGSYNCVSGGRSRFADVLPTDVACKHLHYLAARGANVPFECTATNRACPTAMSTRAAMAVMVAGSIAAGGDAGVPAVGTFNDTGTARSYNCAVTGGSHFSDVTSAAAYCRHANYLWARGMIDGFTDGTFHPELGVTRGQMAKFIGNALRLTTE